MKILNPTSSRKDLLDRNYACELSGWEIAAITALCHKFAGGSPEYTMRGYCDSIKDSGFELFPFLFGKSHTLFTNDGSKYFTDSSKEDILELEEE